MHMAIQMGHVSRRKEQELCVGRGSVTLKLTQRPSFLTVSVRPQYMPVSEAYLIGAPLVLWSICCPYCLLCRNFLNWGTSCDVHEVDHVLPKLSSGYVIDFKVGATLVLCTQWLMS